MSFFTIAAILVSFAAFLSFINYRFIKLPTTIGVMLIALFFSLALIVLEKFGVIAITASSKAMLQQIDFNATLMQGMLSFLLFAGALHVDLQDLLKQRWVVLGLATIGLLISTAIIGVASWYLFQALGLNISLLYCLIFGALISPTDPIAVIGILKTASAPKSLEIKIAGESLFNDGVAVVVYLVLLSLINGSAELSVSGISLLFVEEALGGILFGLASGWITYRLLAEVDDYSVEVMLTLALVMGGYALASAIHVSGPLAIVVAGLFIGNHGRQFAMSDTTREHLDHFWELIDEILNAVLFVLIGLEVLVLSFSQSYLYAALALAPLMIMARFVSVGIPIQLFRLRRSFSPHATKVLTWGGLRGGISVALALSLPIGPARDTLLAITYMLVIFSIVVQGLSMGKLVKVTQRTQ